MAPPRTFTMDLTPSGPMSCVLLDGEEISGMLEGVRVESDVHGGTKITLYCAARHRVTLTARLPEAQIVLIAHEDEPHEDGP